MLDKNFDSQAIENRIYNKWEESGSFRPDPDSGKPSFVIMMPPPNVTGSLHMGHALNNTLQDILVRYHRMKGFDALWLPGTDHAGIATQMVVERQLEEEGLHRRDLGREKFLERVWKWKEQSGGTIIKQLRHLGASADWSRERFTMDEGLSDAVRKLFVDLHRDGLIYRDKKLVNWDPKRNTAVSDLEVEQREVKGFMHYIQYKVEDTENEYITIATTRPETMLGDTAIIVHPDDERYKHLHGCYAVLPLVGRRLKIVPDDYVEPEKGTGAMKVTPAHDFNDFEIGRRHDLEMINIFDENAHILAEEWVPAAYRGLDRFDARAKILADLEASGDLLKKEENIMQIPYGQRSGVVIEPYLSDQWWVNAAHLAKPALEVVRSGKIKFVPQNWEKTYYQWLENIQPWCISRQLWWGHQIPAWYAEDGTVFVAMDEDDAQSQAKAHFGKEVPLRQDEDVLDTWFSSQLWPFSTLGWPEKTPDLKQYYPGDVLLTGFDIIFFWVARMIMAGLYTMDDIPFHTVYFTGLVRDEKGQKMSKSKGNVIDPLDLIKEYGCDAMRLTMTIMETQGRDIKMSPQRVEGYRNFTTKLWNAARFCEMNECGYPADFDPNAVKHVVNQWLVAELLGVKDKAESALAAYRFNDLGETLYHFTWGSFCDWYVELIKPLLQSGDEALIAETRATCGWALGQILHLAHPVIPYITEELWAHLSGGGAGLLISNAWPDYTAITANQNAGEEVNWVIGLIQKIRAIRAEMNVPASAKIHVLLKDLSKNHQEMMARHEAIILRLARLESLKNYGDESLDGALQAVFEEATMILPLAEVIDLGQERARLDKELKKLSDEMQKIEGKLGNEGFVAKAPPEVIELQKERLEEARSAKARLEEALRLLASA